MSTTRGSGHHANLRPSPSVGKVRARGAVPSPAHLQDALLLALVHLPREAAVRQRVLDDVLVGLGARLLVELWSCGGFHHSKDLPGRRGRQCSRAPSQTTGAARCTHPAPGPTHMGGGSSNSTAGPTWTGPMATRCRALLPAATRLPALLLSLRFPPCEAWVPAAPHGPGWEGPMQLIFQSP